MTKSPPLEDPILVGSSPRSAPEHRTFGLPALALAFLGGGLVVGVLAAAARPGLGSGSNAAAVRSPEGRLRVSYMVETSPTSASGSTMDHVTGIEFYPGYVVVTSSRDGRGRVFFNDRTRELSWFEGE